VERHDWPCWTSNEDVAHSLLEWTAPTNPNAPGYVEKCRAVELAAALATPVLVPQLLQVARDRDRFECERITALRALRRLGVAIPADTLCRMLEEAVDEWRADTDEIFELLRYADSLDDTMLAVLDGCSPFRRRRLLESYENARYSAMPLPKAVFHALWRRWSYGVGLEREPPRDVFGDRKYHRRADPPLTGDPAALRAELGVARLLELVDTALSAREGSPQHRGACAVLRELPEGRRKLARMLASREHPPWMQVILWAIALDIDRAATLAHVARFPRVWCWVAQAIARAPRPDDRAFAEAAARSDDPETAYWAIAAIDLLDEPLGPLPMAELPRVRALAALARRRDRSAVAALVDATSAPEADVRAEAMRWLGRLDDAREHLAVFERGLTDDAPVAAQAALALHRMGGSRTALLHACFFAESASTSWVIADLLCDRTEAANLVLEWSPFAVKDD
jgi:hypothetical protein